MMTRIESTFARLRQERRGGLATYTTAGDPDLPTSADILKAIDRAGADVLEVGVPFSDPLADGTVQAPIGLFTYANPIHRHGLDAFVSRAAAAGVDGVLVLDVPVEEAGPIRAALAARGLHLIFLVSPTTSDRRLAEIAHAGSGFLYCISRLGVTGARDSVAGGAETLVRRIRAHTALPVALGFGLSKPEHVAEVAAYADAAVVGSALVARIAEEAGSPEIADRIGAYVRWLRGAGRNHGDA
jgi:tryptophan synthase alpha chain